MLNLVSCQQRDRHVDQDFASGDDHQNVGLEVSGSSYLLPPSPFDLHVYTKPLRLLVE